MTTNTQVLIAALPEGKLEESHYRIEEGAMPELPENGVVVKTSAFAITAGTRAGLQGSASYAGAPSTGIVMNSTGVGEVVESGVADIPVGSMVVGPTGWQSYSAHEAKAVTAIHPSHNPLHYLGPLGVNGLTAYFGLLEVGQPKSGETVMVSAAAGSVGHMVGQIAKIKGSRVVGVCGSEEKCIALTHDLGFDEAVNYKDDGFRDSLKGATPDGVDVYFDNTGGMILGADTDRPEPGPKGIPGLLVNKRINMRGFLVFDFAHQYDQARAEIHGWLESGEMQALTDEVSGLEAAPAAFVDLLSGGNIGTRVVRLD